MEWGDPIKWIYRHYLNSKSYVLREKTGIYIRNVVHSEKYKGKQMAVVRFNRNKNVSLIPLSELIDE